MEKVDLQILKRLLKQFREDHFDDVARQYDSDDNCVDEMMDHVDVVIRGI